MITFFKRLTILSIVIGSIGGSLSAQEGDTPQKQIDEFYVLCKKARASEAMQKVLTATSNAKPEDTKKVSDDFGKMVQGMGDFLDYEFLATTKVSERIVVLRVVAHFKNQPFVNEFTFYNAEKNSWRLVHMRYDANVATMFLKETS